MRILPNLLALAWGLLVLGSLFLTYAGSAGSDPAARAAARITVFLLWQGTALLVALIAAGFSLKRHDTRGSRIWWMGWGPLFGSIVTAIFVGLAVLSSKLL